MKPRLDLITVADVLQMHRQTVGKGHPDSATRALMKITNNTQKGFTMETTARWDV